MQCVIAPFNCGNGCFVSALNYHFETQVSNNIIGDFVMFTVYSSLVFTSPEESKCA